jgi:signal transduction histidine kinase
MIASAIIGFGLAAAWVLRPSLSLLPTAEHTVFTDLRDGVFVLDAEDRIADLNPAAASIAGQPADRLRGRPVSEVLAGLLAALLQQPQTPGETVELEVGEGVAQRVYELRVLSIDTETDANAEREVDAAADRGAGASGSPDADPREALGAGPMDPRSPVPPGRVVMLREITAYKHAQTLLHAEFLAEVSAALASSLDYEDTLQQVARLAIPALGDWCTVYMLGEDRQVRRVAVAHTEGEKAELALALRRYPPSPVAPRSSVAEAMRTGRSILTPVIPQEYTAMIAQDAEHLEIMRRLAFRSSMTVPLRARGETLGALAFFSSEPDRRYDQADLALAEDLARRAGLALDNARLYREAQRAIRARDEFLSVAAHELKTPLTSMLGFAQMLKRHVRPDGSGDARIVRRALQAVEQQSDRLARLVSRLLDVARIEGGRLAVEPLETDIMPLVATVIETIQASGSHERFEVRAPEHVRAVVDPLRFEQVLTNLLDNAAKFSPRSDPILVEIAETSLGMLRVAVTDRGPGIPPEGRDHIFDRFYQAHEGNHAFGMGLGLYICRQIVEQHGGSIGAEFPVEGGTRFVFTLPIGPVADGTPAATA